jgi:hypothetical protein
MPFLTRYSKVAFPRTEVLGKPHYTQSLTLYNRNNTAEYYTPNANENRRHVAAQYLLPPHAAYLGNRGPMA